MSWSNGPDLLAAAPAGGGYFAVWKLVVFLVLVVPWLHVAGYLDKDLRDMNFKRGLWNCVIVAAGVLGLAIWLIVPWFAVGVLVYLVLAVGGVAMYVLWRNARVDEPYRIFTPEHVGEMIRSRGKSKKGRKPTDVDERVKLKLSGSSSPITAPTDQEGIATYRVLQDLLFDAISKRATVLEILETGAQAKILYEIDGVASQRDAVAKEDAERIIAILKQICEMDLEQKRRPQRAKLAATVGLTGMDLEVETAGSTSGERVTVRIIGEERAFTIKDLGFRQTQLAAAEEIVKEKPEGVVLVCGTPGAGVTTTLYALLRTHDAYMNNIQTLEREIRMPLDDITQHVWKPGDEKTHAEALRSVIRQDPDIVMLARCDEAETAKQVAEGAGRGKKLYVGVEAPNVFKALSTWVRWVGDAKTASQHLIALTAQHLARKLCTECREAYRPDAEMLRKANLPADRIDRFYRPRTRPLLDEKGNPMVCPTCQGSGYFGRTGVFELLIVSDALRGLLAQGPPMEQIMRQARKEKTLTLQEEGLRRVIEGQSSINEILRASREKPAKPQRKKQ